MSFENKNILPSKNKKTNLKQKKENTISSLFEVENFLRDFRNILKYIKLYNILK